MKAKYKCKGCGNHYCAMECPNGCDLGFYVDESAPDVGKVKVFLENAMEKLSRCRWPMDMREAREDVADALKELGVL